MGVYSLDSIAKYINFCDIIKEKTSKYPFAIFDTDRDIYPEKDLVLFDSFGFVGFKQFFIDNDSTIIDKMLFSLKKKQNNHINLVSLNFSIKAYKKLKEKNSQENLTDTAKDFST